MNPPLLRPEEPKKRVDKLLRSAQSGESLTRSVTGASRAHTYAILEVSVPVYEEIRKILAASGYGDQFHKAYGAEVIDMHGLALKAVPFGRLRPQISKPDRGAGRTEQPKEAA